jgi:UDP:flavonoid glycosyltransferase YjiC (YdhE family)
MSRFLFVVPPLTGHVTPLVAVARQLTGLGHAVLWCGDPTVIGLLAGAQASVRACPAGGFHPAPQPPGLRGYAAVRQLWEGFLVPLADACVDAVTEAGRRFGPDVVVADMQALAGPLAAARLGVPWATSATTSAPLRESFGATPKVRAWLDGLLADLARRHAPATGRPLPPRDLELSPTLVITFTTEALAGGAGIPPQVRFVGPALAPRAACGPPFPWDLLDGRPLVVTTLGTLNAAAGGPFLAACAEAAVLLHGRVQEVIADPAGVLGDGDPPTVITRPYLPVPRLLESAAVVICHGGHNTVCEALAHGVPLVVAPIRDDQPVIAAQVSDAGVGIRLRFGRATPGIVRDAVAEVIDRPGFAERASAVKASFDAAGSGPAAAAHLLALAGCPSRTGPGAPVRHARADA